MEFNIKNDIEFNFFKKLVLNNFSNNIGILDHIHYKKN